jgi:hypothetical protein
MRLTKLIVIMAAVLLFAQVQCVRTCAAEECASFGVPQSGPPCHSHHDSSGQSSGPQAPEPCTFHLVLSSATLAHSPQVEAPVIAAPAVVPARADSLALDAQSRAPVISDSSPPGVSALSSAILRI